MIGGGEGSGNSLMFKNLKKGGDWVVMDPSQNNEINVMGVENGKIYLITDWNAPRKRLMVADVAAPQRENWKALIPEGEGVMKGVQFAADKMIVTVEKDATDHAYVYSKDGKLLKEMQFPTYGTVGISSDKDSNEVYYALSSFTSPSTRYSYNLETGESTVIGTTDVNGVNMDDYVTEQVLSLIHI